MVGRAVDGGALLHDAPEVVVRVCLAITARALYRLATCAPDLAVGVRPARSVSTCTLIP